MKDFFLKTIKLSVQMEFLKIDGAHGEGGGQIVRTATALSCITKRPIIIENIRKNRRAPGLKAQHVAAIKILQKICNARMEGVNLNSTEMRFIPSDIQSCKLKEDIGTAGSICLILLSVIPAMAVLGKSELRITGGTDVPWSPTFDYMLNVVRDVFCRMGMQFSAKLNKRGYYPRGRGEVVVNVSSQKIVPVRLISRETNLIEIKCSYSKISEEIIKGEVSRIAKKLEESRYIVKHQIRREVALDSGASILAHINNGDSVLGADALFDTKTGSFELKLGKITENRLGVDENLADMIVLPASIASGMSVFWVPRITKHLETNLFVASKISGCRYGIGKMSGGFEVRIEGVSHPGV